jgi:hypothetical protein
MIVGANNTSTPVNGATLKLGLMAASSASGPTASASTPNSEISLL